MLNALLNFNRTLNNVNRQTIVVVIVLVIRKIEVIVVAVEVPVVALVTRYRL